MYNWSSSTVGIATTADPVSWVAGKMTLQENPTSSSISLLKSPTIVPGSEISPKIFSGYPRHLSLDLAAVLLLHLYILFS